MRDTGPCLDGRALEDGLGRGWNDGSGGVRQQNIAEVDAEDGCVGRYGVDKGGARYRRHGRVRGGGADKGRRYQTRQIKIGLHHFPLLCFGFPA